MSYFNGKRYSLKQIVIFLTIAFSLVTVISYAAVLIPNTFTAGTTISASQVNANFDALKTAVDSKQDRPALGSFPTTSAGQVAWAHISCPSSGGGCWVVNSYNPTGGAVSATSYGTGIGGVTFTGMTVDNANIQVGPGMFFRPRICHPIAVSGENVNVRCDDLTGTASLCDFWVTVML